MVMIYRVNQIKLNQFVYENVRVIVHTYLSAITVTNISQSFYLQDGGENQLAWIWNEITPYV